MTINIPVQIISGFLNGVIAIFAVIGVGALLFYILQGIERKHPFTRLALVIALAPLSLINFLGHSESTALFIFAMISALLGISIDSINHLILPNKEQSDPAQDPVSQEEDTAASNPGAVSWDKAVNKYVLPIALVVILMTVLFASMLLGLIENASLNDQRVKELVDTNGKQFGKISGKVEKRLGKIEKPLARIEERLDKEFEKTASISTDVKKCLTLTEKMQEEITELSSHVVSLQEALADKDSDAVPEEVQPAAPVSKMMPENSDFLQPISDNGIYTDSIPFPSEPTETISIDYKFPLESYLRMTDPMLSTAERRSAEQQFLHEFKNSKKTFWVLVENTQLTGKYNKVQSMRFIENMEANALRNEIKDLKEFIKNNCTTSP